MNYCLFFIMLLVAGCGNAIVGNKLTPTDACTISIVYHYEYCWESLGQEKELEYIQELNNSLHNIFISVEPTRNAVPSTEGCEIKYKIVVLTDNIDYLLYSVEKWYQQNAMNVKIIATNEE